MRPRWVVEREKIAKVFRDHISKQSVKSLEALAMTEYSASPTNCDWLVYDLRAAISRYAESWLEHCRAIPKPKEVQHGE
jgi:hypothetical protein